VIDSFESGSLNAYQTVLRYAPSAEILPVAAHDGNQGLVKQDGYEWMIRNDDDAQVAVGATVSVWTKFAGTADGRAYLGFDARPNGTSHSPLSAGGLLSLVLAPNTNQLILENNPAFAMPGITGQGGTGTQIAAVSQTYQADHWYRMEVTWGSGNTFTGRLYDSDGTTLLNTVSGTATPQFTSGGVAFRAFGHDKYFDTLVIDSDSSGTAALRASAGGGLDPNWTPGPTPPPAANGPSNGHAFVPWGYASAPGTGRDVELAAFNDLQQVAIIGNTVGLAAGNLSAVHATNQIGWGPPVYGAFNSGVPVETPLLAQYLFRQLPGEATQLIGSSDVKHFFSSAHTDSQHLNPGESDAYGSSLNATQSLYSPGSEVDPVTGALHRADFMGLPNNDGVNVSNPRPPANSIDRLLQVNVADLDPAQNPAGTHWYLMGNLFVAGDQDTSNNSRWVEVVPHFDGTRFTFTYPNGSGGQSDFRTIPGLVDPGLSVTSASTGRTVNAQPFSSIVVAFDRAIQASTFTADQISLTGPNGAITISNITPANSSNSSFTLSFAQQSALGVYTLVIGPNILDSSGNPMQQAYTTQFTIEGPRIIAQTPSGTNNLPNTVNHVRLTFNEPINPSTFTLADVFAVGPNGMIPISSITAVAGSNNTQFDINFATLTKTGSYDLFVLPFIMDLYGNLLDQNQDFVGGELPGDIYVAQFGITGPQVVSAVANSNVAGEVYSLRVTFNEDMDPSSFTPSQIASFTDPNGRNILSSVFGVVQVSPTNFRQFDVLFLPQTTSGTYTMVIGPHIRDVYGNEMDQDADAALPVETPGDQYTATLTVNGPRLVATDPVAGGVVAAPFDHLRVTFNTPIQASSFTTGQVALTDPGGNAVNIVSVTPVDFSNNTQFDVTFDPQTARGTYSLTVGPGIQDAYGNPMDNPFTATLRIAITYTASDATFQNIEIFGQAGTQVVTFTSGQVTADDDFGTINLGSNSFNFYGVNYNQLFVSSNGLITFGSGNASFRPTSLAGNPSQAAIAPYWTDLFKSGTEPMIVWRIDGNQLIIEWYKVGLFDDHAVQMTFQVILQLNTGGSAGDIVFNYVSVTGTGDQPENLGVTVGVKDAGTATTVTRTLVEDGTTYSPTGDPRVQTGKAIRLHG
jgi:methionine-rich copper-binding protein CopC